jgi:hypothetical protein
MRVVDCSIKDTCEFDILKDGDVFRTLDGVAPFIKIEYVNSINGDFDIVVIANAVNLQTGETKVFGEYDKVILLNAELTIR